MSNELLKLADDERIRQIAEHYGIKNQSMIAIEECSELQKALCKRMRYGAEYDADVAEEIADVLIMASQIAYLLKLEGEVVANVDCKIRRQMERMEQ